MKSGLQTSFPAPCCQLVHKTSQRLKSTIIMKGREQVKQERGDQGEQDKLESGIILKVCMIFRGMRENFACLKPNKNCNKSKF